jgi:hypothetical protein
MEQVMPRSATAGTGQGEEMERAVWMQPVKSRPGLASTTVGTGEQASEGNRRRRGTD